VVPVARAHAGAHRPHRRGGRRGLRRGLALTGPLERLAAELEAEGGLLAGALAPALVGDGRLGAAAAGGPRAAGDPGAYALLVEAIREGSLLHYASGRVLAPEDPDLALLGGDRLYAIGLDRLAALGDVEAVAELADVISLVAQAQAEGDPERAEAVWEAGAHAVGAGTAPDHEAAKAAWRGAG
jgi:hypothetical protein